MSASALARIPIEDLAALLDLEPGITVASAWMVPGETRGMALTVRLEGPGLPPAEPGFSPPKIVELPRRKNRG